MLLASAWSFDWRACKHAHLQLVYKLGYKFKEVR